jgi:DNA-binding NtrC family response regulator
MSDILVIDDDRTARKLIRAIFRADGLEVIEAEDAASGLARAVEAAPALVLLDLHLPGAHDLSVLEALRRAVPALPVILLTAHHDVKTAVRSIQLGAFDYLTKPVDRDELLIVARRALETRALKAEVAALRSQLADGGLAVQMGPSPQVAAIVDQVGVVAGSDFTVLVLGETGTGKELVARAVHTASPRAQRPFVALDCGAIPEPLLESELFGHEKGAFTGADRKKEGLFQIAEGGTLFLDEIGNLPPNLQAKLLRVLESRQVQAVGAARPAATDVRFVAATNDDLPARAERGLFRADLYFRLAQYTIALPALRDRAADIAYLGQRFVDEAAIEVRRPVQRIAPDAIELLERHRWPGNVRELRNVIRRAVLQTADATVSLATIRALLGRDAEPAAPARRRDDRPLREIAQAASDAAERQAIAEALRESRGNKARAARALRTDYKTLHLKMKHLGIRARDYVP